MESNKKSKIKNLVLDVDGVLTDGRYYYTKDGKVMKIFGPDDHDALLILKDFLNIIMVTGDKRGFEITERRVRKDMKFPLELVSTFERVEWMEENGFKLEETIYMGDGIFDIKVFDKVAYGIAPANAFYLTKKSADFITSSEGGNSAVAEACIHILEKFFEIKDIKDMETKGGVWGGKND